MWVICILSVTFLYVFAHNFTDLNFMAVLLVTKEPSRGNTANARHGGRLEITDKRWG